MHLTKKLATLAMASCVVMGGLVHWFPADAGAQKKHHVAVPRGFPIVDGVEEARTIYDYQQLMMWNALSDINAYFTAVQAEVDRERAQEAADQAEAARMAAEARNAGAGKGQISSPLPQVNGGGGGSCYGGPVPDYIVTRESRGDPNAVNSSSGAFGCYQIMPANWADPTLCGGISGRDVASQQQCATILEQKSQAAGNSPLAPWGG